MNDQAILESLLPPMQKLNAWARLPYEERLQMPEVVSQIYRYKRSVIRAAILLGIANLRIVAVERPCKTCKGTGEYKWQNWHDEDDVRYEDCRRCGATGKVILRFVASEICGVKWHTPRPKWDLGVFEAKDWESASDAELDWEPEQPGRPLERIELIEALNEVERVILPPLVPWENWPRTDSKLPPYRLHFGKITACPFCGKDPADGLFPFGPYSTMWRPAFSWEQNPCWGDGRRCSDRAWSLPLQWPHDLQPPRGGINDQDQWEYHVPIPEIGRRPAVVEWLERRGIVVGEWPPDQMVWHQSGVLLSVKAAMPGGRLLVLNRDSEDWLSDPDFSDEHLFEIPSSSVRARQRGGPWTTTPPIDYPDQLEMAL